jgi:phosphodiesterase/alkaline phosphatase D-like protein
LKEALSASTARFKILLNSTPITDWSDTVIGDWAQDDRWQGHPADRDEILRHIATNGITGVLWLAGDHHFGAITHVDPTGGIGQDQIEVLCGPAGSSINLASYAIPENERYPHIVSDLNWALFEVDPETGGIIVVFVANDGSEIVRWSTVL